MTAIPTLVEGATCIAVSSGKGGVGKTTTAAAIAVALAARGHDVVAIDADTTGANLHLVLGVDDVTLTAAREPLELTLPAGHGVRLATPASLTGNVRVEDLVALVRFAAWPTHIVVDLPGGWGADHGTIAELRPDVIVCAVAPTVTAVADHAAHIAAWRKAWAASNKKLRDSDGRRKWAELADEPAIIEVETMARFRGTAEDSGDTVTIRRSDALSVTELAEHANVIASMPATATIGELAASAELATVVDALEKFGS